ncbi:MAG: AbrB/MazE/SpoVT family DNA-binding domain-containing protein [Nanoarchaeota archaeon]|nr:AbrB/MazE/SpoVT family DNA-binding domain-containing protein [Nanoarchaeota archaeon]
MERTIVHVKKWGNSFGIVLPMKIVEKEKLSEGKEIIITVETKDKTKVRDVFGMLAKELKNINTQKALRDVDKAFWPED